MARMNDEHGCSTCTTPGTEKYEKFQIRGLRNKRLTRYQYDYRHTDGELFSCCAPSLEVARQRRDAWLQKKGGAA